MVYFMVVIFSLICPEGSAFDYLYLEMEHLMKGSCFPRDSCSPPRPENQDHLWGNYTCECGPHCTRYGTCCANSPHVGEMPRVEYRREACQRLSPAFPQSVISVSCCPARWRGGCHVRQRCDRSADIAEDPMSAVPVTSLATHVTYKNYFCAMCNYDHHDVSLWDVELNFDGRESVAELADVTKSDLLENIFYDHGTRAWGIAVNDAFYKVKFKFKVPVPVQKLVKKCYPNTMSRCAPSFSDNYELQYKCSSYYAPISVVKDDGSRRFTKYHNVHCAVCNGANLTGSDSIACRLDKDDKKKMFSLSHLLDINRGDGEIVGHKQVVCGEREKWDPFFKKCRSMVCAVPGYVVKNGQCVQS